MNLAESRKKHREYMLRWKANNLASGRCGGCAAPNSNGRIACDTCLEIRRLRARRYRQDPEEKRKRVARESVRKALKNGRLVKPAVCEDCRSRMPLHAHHADYSKRREVRWLCAACHALHNRKAA